MDHKIQAYRYGETRRRVPLDPSVIIPAVLLSAMGLIMVVSAAIAIAEAQSLPAYHYLVRHIMFLAMGTCLALVFRVISTRHLENISQPMMLIGLLLWWSNPPPWMVFLALLIALGAMFFQYLQARTYWLHSLTFEEGVES